MKNKLMLVTLFCFCLATAYSQKKHTTSLVPAKPSSAPDYFCTWSLQGYVVSYSSTLAQQQEMNEKNMFISSHYGRWGDMFSRLHKDLYLVLDDTWDAPINGDRNYYGSLQVDPTRFPSVKGLSPEKRLTWLSEKTKSLGWKGLGLWICAQQAPHYKQEDSVAYWTERLVWMDRAGVNYWKVDWGDESERATWRAWLTKLGKKVAPNLIIEQALTPAVLTTAELFRTYDVESVISVPHTIDRIAKLLVSSPQGKALSIINCEDEPYIAAGTGSSLGIMRHSLTGSLPNGKQDNVFPPVGRDLKTRLDEEVRCVMWHRIAAPFGINKTDTYIDTVRLHDYWIMKNEESWMDNHGEGYINSWQAPAIITRGVERPIVSLPKGDSIMPYVLTSRYPNGAIAVATIGRTIGRHYITPRADIVIKVANCNKPFGVFGHYNSLTIQVDQQKLFSKILAQDLAGHTPVNITDEVIHNGNKIIIPGKLIDRVGLAAASKDDKSEPGMVMIFQK